MVEPQSEGREETSSTPQQSEARKRYWDAKFLASNAFLILFAAVAAYLEYSVYPQIMSGPGGFGETNVNIHLSFLTFRIDATRCGLTGCPTLVGVPSLDFFQLFLIAIVLINVVHYARYWR